MIQQKEIKIFWKQIKYKLNNLFLILNLLLLNFLIRKIWNINVNLTNKISKNTNIRKKVNFSKDTNICRIIVYQLTKASANNKTNLLHQPLIAYTLKIITIIKIINKLLQITIILTICALMIHNNNHHIICTNMNKLNKWLIAITYKWIIWCIINNQ